MINRLNNVIMIKFNSIHLFICSFFFIVLFSSCSHDSIDTSVSRLKDTDVVELTQTPETNFTVSNGTLSKYLKLFYKGKAIDKVEPIIKDGDILGYLVQYSNNNGWDVISSDIRLSPVLLSCPEGKIDLTKSEDKLMIQGMIEPYYAKRKEKSGNAINGTWAFLLGKTKIQSASPSGLLPSTKSQNKINGRGLGQGMWLPVDTTIRESIDECPRRTTTTWYQSDPFNKYTPKQNNQHCPVGCSPVAIGQLLYLYYLDDPNKFSIPTVATYSNNEDTVYFHNLTTSAWQSLVLTYYPGVICDTVSMFLSWVGKEMGVEYDLNGSRVTWEHETAYLNTKFNYRVGFPVNNATMESEFCDTLFSSISYGSPVFISTTKLGTDSLHTFLIDQYKNNVSEYVITYVFDPYHNITEDDMLNYPQWCFQWPGPSYGYDPDKDTAELEVIVNGSYYMYVRMNWGWYPYHGSVNSINDTYFLLRAKDYYIGEAGTTMDYEQVFLTWTPRLNFYGTYSGIYQWAHHFTKK